MQTDMMFFVGGFLDGDYSQVPHRQRSIELIDRSGDDRSRPLGVGCVTPKSATLTKDIWTRRSWKLEGADEPIEIMGQADLHDCDIIRKLIAGYKPDNAE